MASSKIIQDPVAIVGISAEFPSGTYSSKNLDAPSFFDFLLHKGQSYEKIPRERFNIDAWLGTNSGQIVTDTGSFLKDIAAFDPVEFGVSSKEAKSMPVSTRKLLEHSFLALWDAGIPYRGRNVGCYMSAVAFDVFSLGDYNEFDAAGSFGGYPSMVANRISYHLDLHGPSIPIDTACSSTATALHLAIQSIRSGDCDAAIVGGSQLNHRLIDFIQYSQGSILAPDGKCKPFDASANGFSRGEGVAVIVLKPLHLAIKEGDHIYASILGTGINSTGSRAPMYAPVAAAQEEAMHSAYAQTGRLPTEVDYIELHATGTALGDPTEANWVGKAFKREDGLLIGSVKGNIGHLEITSFLASLCKVCFMFQTRLIPPNVNLNVRNPNIKWDEYRLRVATEVQPFPYRSEDALVSITSSGIGGANAHVVLESYSVPELHSATTSRPVLIVSGGLSIRSTVSINEELSRIVSSSSPTPLPTISAVYGRRSSQMNWRSFAIVKPDGIAKFSEPQHVSRKQGPLVFVLSGQGPQHFNMGRQLFVQNATFRRSIIEMDSHYEATTGYSLIERTGLFANVRTNTFPDIWPIEITLPALAMLQMALIDLLRDIGLVPDAVIGHSAGETAMLYACGAGSRNMALEIAIMRGRAMAEIEGHGGGMAAFSCSPDIAKEVIRDVSSSCNSMLEIACFNAAEAVTLAGPATLLDEAVEIARKRGIVAQKLRTKVPVHSRIMDICHSSYSEGVTGVFLRYRGAHRPKITTFSTLTGYQWTESFTAEYFWQNARSPVFFNRALGSLQHSFPDATFVEISPHPVLSPYLSSAARSPDSIVCPMRRVKNEDAMNQYTCFLGAIARLVMLGYHADFLKLNDMTTIPAWSPSFPYPFAKKSIPYHSESSMMVQRQMEGRNGPLNYNGLRLGTTTHPDLAQHVINNQPILPAAGFLEMAFEFGARFLWNIRFKAMLPLQADKTIPIEVSNEGAYWSVKSRPDNMGLNTQSRLHADGYMSAERVLEEDSPLDINQIKQECGFLVKPDELYNSIAKFAQYQSLFRRVEKLYIGDGAALAQVAGYQNDLFIHNRPYVFNPAILDACFHVMLHPSFTGLSDPHTYYLPSGIQAVVLHDSIPFPQTVYAYATLKYWQPDEIHYDLIITHASGQRICTFVDFSVACHGQTSARQISKSYDLIYQRLDIPDFPEMLFPSQDDTQLSLSNHQANEILDRAYLIAIVREVVNFIVCNASKKVVRIFEISRGTELLLDIAQFQDILTMHHCEGVLFNYWYSNPAVDQSAHEYLPVVVKRVDHEHYFKDASVLSATFDIVIIYDTSTFPANGINLLTVSNTIVPGGCLIVSDSNDWSSFTRKCELEEAKLTPLVYPDGAGISTFVAQKHLPPSPSLLQEPFAIEFTFDVAKLQHQIRHFHSSGSSDLWIYASWTIGGAVGFVRSLRREMRNISIRLVLFPDAWSKDRRFNFIQSLAQIPNIEPEIKVEDDGSIMLPRFFPSPTKPEERRDSITLSRPIQDNHVLVEVLDSYVATAGLCGLIGRTTKSGTTAKSDLVVGVTDEESPLALSWIYKPRILSLPATKGTRLDAHTIVTLVIATWAVGLASIRHPVRLEGKRITLTDENSISATLSNVFLHFGATVQTVSVAPSLEFLDAIRKSDLIISGCTSSVDIQNLRSALRDNASLRLWADKESGPAACIRRDPWIIHDAVTEFLTKHQPLLQRLNPPLKTPSSVDPSPKLPLFQSQKAYILIGGIGSIGFEVALWMYKNGAREIVLTSRSGPAFLRRSENISYLRISHYLQGLPDINLHMVACDGSSHQDMARLMAGIASPLGGIILLSGVIRDCLFYSQTESTFRDSFTPKVGVLTVLASTIAISSLDFLIAISSVATFGSAGQTNYTSANTAMDWMLSKFQNAFSILAPLISDSSVAAKDKDGALSHWESWSMTSRDLCNCIRDGLLKLRSRRLWLYVPDFDWNEVNRQLGSSPLYDHLVSGDTVRSAETASTTENSRDELRKLVCDLLDVQQGDFSEQTPLTSYGLDSLVAGRLSFAIRPFIQLTQLELLSDMTFDDIYYRVNDEARDPGTNDNKPGFDWNKLNQIGETVLKLVDGGGIPLIAIHGGSGNIVPFIPLQERFSTPLWAIQATPETPLGSIQSIAQFYYDRIKEKLPSGPYRLAGYSASVLIAYELAFTFEANGDQVVQLINLDYHPWMFTPPIFTIDEETCEKHYPSAALIRQLLEFEIAMSDADPDARSTRAMINNELVDAHHGLSTRDFIKDYYHFGKEGIASSAVRLLTQLAKDSGKDISLIMNDGDTLRSLMMTWMRRIKAPVQIVLPQNGSTAVMKQRGLDFLSDLTRDMVSLTDEEGGHFSLFENEAIINFIQYSWKM